MYFYIVEKQKSMRLLIKIKDDDDILYYHIEYEKISSINILKKRLL